MKEKKGEKKKGEKVARKNGILKLTKRQKIGNDKARGGKEVTQEENESRRL